jgi:acyl-CoA dehydrogenase
MPIFDPAILTRLRSLPAVTGSATQRCDALIGWVRAQGLLHFTLPPDLGGAGAALDQAIAVTFALARQSGSAGLTYAMHMGQLMTWAGHLGTSAYLRAELHDLAAQGGLIASVVSEPRTGGDIHHADARLDLGAGQVLTFRKESSNTSYVAQAAAFLVTGMAEAASPGRPPIQRLLMVRADATQARVLRQNLLMGMQGIHNAAYDFTFSAPPEAVFAAPFPTIASATMTPATHLLWAAVWSGLAAHALEIAQSFVKAEVAEALRPAALIRLSDLRNRHYLINALIRDNLAPGGHANPFEAAARINRLKIMASEAAREVVLACLDITGLRGYAEAGPYSLSELLRDVLSGPIMVSNARLQANTSGIDRYSAEAP